MAKVPVALRIDDVGASSKCHEVYGRTRVDLGPFKNIPFPGNFLFLKHLKPFRVWGPYRELSSNEWEGIFEYCEQNQIKLTLGITAGWVERDGTVVPFPEKYPDQAETLKKALRGNLVEIANHGYTHCVLQNRAFLPKLFSGNRNAHREFWKWIPIEIQEQHITVAQNILQSFFGSPAVTFIPPGNIFTNDTLRIAKKYGLHYLSCSGIEKEEITELIPIPKSQVIAFHDKELVEQGMDWLESIQPRFQDCEVQFIKEIGQKLEFSNSL